MIVHLSWRVFFERVKKLSGQWAEGSFSCILKPPIWRLRVEWRGLTVLMFEEAGRAKFLVSRGRKNPWLALGPSCCPFASYPWSILLFLLFLPWTCFVLLVHGEKIKKLKKLIKYTCTHTQRHRKRSFHKKCQSIKRYVTQR